MHVLIFLGVSAGEMESLNNIVASINGFLWGYILVALLVGTGIFLTIRMRGIQIFGLGHGIRLIRGLYDKKDDEGDLSHSQALSTALAATVGVGNIAGVAIAIRAGGPGALFWMWVTAAVGMATKFTSCALAVKYRKINEDGSVSGGPMYFIEQGLGKNWKWLAVAFAVLAGFGAFGAGCMAQAGELARAFIALIPSLADPEYVGATVAIQGAPPLETVPASRYVMAALIGIAGIAFTVSFDRTISRGLAESEYPPLMKSLARPASAATLIVLLSTYLFFYVTHFRFGAGNISFLPSGLGILMSLMVGIVIIGGIRRIGEVTGFLVPFMAIFYVLAALVIIVINAKGLPAALGLIFHNAFTGSAAVGGFAGSAFLFTLREGVRRGLFSNESGQGSAPIAHATAKTEYPAREGYVALLGPFIDTIIICWLTGLVIILTGSWMTTRPIDGADLSAYAFRVGLGDLSVFADQARLGRLLVTSGVILFAYSTAISWSYYGDRCISYLFGLKAVVPYRFAFCFFIIVGATIKIDLVWNLCDVLNGGMAIPNLVALILLSGVMLKELNEYRVKIPDFDREIRESGRDPSSEE